MGPKLAMWLEEHLLLNLEMGFRCARPSLLIQQWARDSGFSMIGGGKIGLVRCLQLPAALPLEKQDMLDQIGVAALREVWTNAWGKYVYKSESDSDSDPDPDPGAEADVVADNYDDQQPPHVLLVVVP